MAVIKLGNFDPDPAIKDNISNFVDAIHKNLKKSEAEGRLRDDNASSLRRVEQFDRFREFESFAGVNIESITQVQKALKNAGFLSGDLEKGFYGYRTRAAIRLFQEYIRAYEDVPAQREPSRWDLRL